MPIRPARETGCIVSATLREVCGECFYEFTGTICPACGYEQWKRWFGFALPNANGEYAPIETHSLSSRHLSLIPKGDRGLVLVIEGTGPDGSWESINKPFGETLVKFLGAYWEHSETEQRCTDENFPPLPVVKEEWLPASQAIARLKSERGIKVNLATMGRHREEFKTQLGGAGVSYEVEFGSFCDWAVEWHSRKKQKAIAKP
jgi:hypothetical protein